MKLPSLHIIWTAEKNLALSDTLSTTTPLEILKRKITVEIPQNFIFFLQKAKHQLD